MASSFSKDSKALHTLYLVLFSLTAAIIAIILIGTVIGLVRPSNVPLVTLGKTDTENISSYIETDDIRVYSGLERLRIPLADSSVMILSLAFPYAANDIAFSEELALRTNELRESVIDYFSNLPAAASRQFSEEAAKNEILRRFNSILRLGRIEALYFSDLMILN